MTQNWRLRVILLGILLVLSSCQADMNSVELRSIYSMADPFAGLLAFSERETVPANVPAFPGAEGFGAISVGGRGGRVIEVTNLNDSGPGSLRAAIEAEGSRTVVFRTGGTIELQSRLEITNPYITIAGQTAPGGGITLKNVSSNSKTPLRIATHDVIIRYIRSRPGASIQPSSSLDALEIVEGYNIIIDHCSFSWAVDEVFSTYSASHDITIQWSIISEGLLNSNHEAGPHSKGVLLGSDANSGRISVHHNLLAHNDERNPRINTMNIVDVVNNVIYNPGVSGGWGPSHITNAYLKTPVNYIGNYYKANLDLGYADYYISTSDPVEIFVQGNITPLRTSDDLPEVDGVVRPSDQQWVVATRHPAPPVTTTSAQDAFDRVILEAGAICPIRDAVDQRVVNDAINGTGDFIDSPYEVGGWPDLAPGVPPTDSDHDGMPDLWEIWHSLNPRVPTDGPEDRDGDGYTNLEDFLNGCGVGDGALNLLPLILFTYSK